MMSLSRKAETCSRIEETIPDLAVFDSLLFITKIRYTTGMARLNIFTDVSGQSIAPNFKDQESFYGTDKSSRNVGRALPLYAAQFPRRP